MPSGTYLHHLAGAEVGEGFQCAPGPVGWRYVGESPGLRVDLAVDSDWRPARLELVGKDWTVRGGRSGDELLWVRSGEGAAPVERSLRAHGFLLDSPGSLVAIARSLRLGEATRSRDVRLVRFTGEALASGTVDQRWTHVGTTEHPTDLGPLPVEEYEIHDVATGSTTELWLAGDVVVGGSWIELAELASPPNLPG